MPWEGIPFHLLIRRTGIILIGQHWVMLILPLAAFWFHRLRMSCRKGIFLIYFFSPPRTSCPSFPWDFLVLGHQGWIPWGETLSLHLVGEKKFFFQLLFPQLFPFSSSSHPFLLQARSFYQPPPVKLQLWFQIFGEFGSQGFSPSPFLF